MRNEQECHHTLNVSFDIGDVICKTFLDTKNVIGNRRFSYFSKSKYIKTTTFLTHTPNEIVSGFICRPR